MKRLLIAPLIFILLSPISSQATRPKLTNEESRAAGGLTFILCKVREGASQDWATNEIESMSKELGSLSSKSETDSSIFKRKNVQEWAELTSENDEVCNMWKKFKSWKEFKSNYQAVIEKGDGEIAFNRLNKKAKKVVKVSAESECLFRLNKINSLQRTEFRANGLKELALKKNQLSNLLTSAEFFKAYKWYFEQIKTQNCKLLD